MPEQRKPEAGASSSLSSTRQLLDELDVLMQRMLDLPVGDSPAEAKGTTVVDLPPQQGETLAEPAKKPFPGKWNPLAPPPSYRYEPPPTAEPEDPTPTVAEDNSPITEAPVPEPEPAPESEPKPKAKPGRVPKKKSKTEPPRFKPEQLSPVSAETLAALTAQPDSVANEPVIQRSRLLAAGATRRKRLWLWPLTATNWIFDAFTHCLGPLGSWLRKPGGRVFLGWLGITFLLAALALQIVMWTL